MAAHFHAEYGEHEALIGIEGLRVIAGDLPARALGLVEEWALIHRRELPDLWAKASRSEPLNRADREAGGDAKCAVGVALCRRMPPVAPPRLTSTHRCIKTRKCELRLTFQRIFIVRSRRAPA
ncbi:MAG: DUF4160 domain-containing protein [Terriglobia bacterium]